MDSRLGHIRLGQWALGHAGGPAQKPPGILGGAGTLSGSGLSLWRNSARPAGIGALLGAGRTTGTILRRDLGGGLYGAMWTCGDFSQYVLMSRGAAFWWPQITATRVEKSTRESKPDATFPRSQVRGAWGSAPAATFARSLLYGSAHGATHFDTGCWLPVLHWSNHCFDATPGYWWRAAMAGWSITALDRMRNLCAAYPATLISLLLTAAGQASVAFLGTIRPKHIIESFAVTGQPALAWELPPPEGTFRADGHASVRFLPAFTASEWNINGHATAGFGAVAQSVKGTQPAGQANVSFDSALLRQATFTINTQTEVEFHVRFGIPESCITGDGSVPGGKPRNYVF